MQSRWVANKIGLINFWYYDEQEFYFAKGRMLLRGSNGSGKSVTMQSVVPLLLDGNMSPERLDPFGSRDRKMNSYLLEEGDDREERIGYLYLEFKKEDSDTYMTIGMGMRARKGKPLDKWYFSLTDGRRVGEDFYLYKQTGDKITLTKKELSNRVENGGQVFDRQADYMEYVNRQIFGFETVEEYKEMVDLLIQLRTPKLSKDFKPTVINDILSDSLQPLSDEELRPMSEAIENMDTMSMNLKARLEGKTAAEKINRALDKYNRLMLWEKASGLVDNSQKIEQVEKEQKEVAKSQKVSKDKITELELMYQELDAKKIAMEKERDLFQQSDIWNLKKQEVTLKESLEQQEVHLEEKEKQLTGKEEKQIELTYKIKEEQEKQVEKEELVRELLEEMEEYAETMAFQDHAFMAAELEEELSKPYSFTIHENQVEKTKSLLKEGCVMLQELDLRQVQVEEGLKKRDQSQREIDQLEREIYELQSLFIKEQSDWKEVLYRWHGNNQELQLSKKVLQELSRKIDGYELTTDYRTIKSDVDEVWGSKKSKLELLKERKQFEKNELDEQMVQLQQELQSWKEQKEPTPERSKEVSLNREDLKKQGIPYQEFYKVLEFSSKLSKEECNRLEEAFLQMGILDALIVEEDYREKVLQLKNGACDKYLFIQKGAAEHSVLDVLELNDNLNDIFLNQNVIRILGNIGFYSEGTTAIFQDGSYQLGVITGTITGNHEAGFLGTKAREANRQRKIQTCVEQISVLEEQIRQVQDEMKQLVQRKEQLETEYHQFPTEDGLRTALQMLSDVEHRQARCREDLEKQEQQLQVEIQKRNDLSSKVSTIAQKLYLPNTSKAFSQAQDAVGSYERCLYELKSTHGMYLQAIGHGLYLEEQLENLELDLDQIRYERNQITKEVKTNRELYQSVIEQLQVEGFEEKQQRMEECIRWLSETPKKMENCVILKTKEENQLDYNQKRQEELEAQSIQLNEKQVLLTKCYQAELQLQYVDLPEDGLVDSKEVTQFLQSQCKELVREKVVQDLNEVYFINQQYLLDYQLVRVELFISLDEEMKKIGLSAKRMDMMARYQGVKVQFQKLLWHLDEEINELKQLIRDGDRELFEDILANTVSRKIRGKINGSNMWVEKMNGLMNSMNTSSGLKLSLKWRYKTAESETQLDTKELVEYLKKDYRLLREEEAERLSMHFRSKVEEARRKAQDSGGTISFYQVMKDTLDYRKWFEFQLFSQKSGERLKELTNSVFGTFSGGEKAMSMYVPLFSAVVAKYQGGSKDAPKLISLDEAFAGVDNKNIQDMFRLMSEFEFDFIINSQVLWGDVNTLDALAIYQLIRPANAKFVTVMPYIWNGEKKELLVDGVQMQERTRELA